MSYIPPKLDLEAFNCPHCNAYAHQIWLTSINGRSPARPTIDTTRFLSDKFAASECLHCKKFALWLGERMIYPNATTAPLPNEDLPDEIKEDFNEARQVFPISPRSSAALLRLVIQKLCKHLGYPGKDLNDDIGKMVGNGLGPAVQQAFDAVRVIGNESVHPGQIDLRDDPDMALKLFDLVNFIVQKMITEPHQIQEIYSNLPQGKLQQIEQRDKKSKPATHP
jgi:hypothetical protein